MLMHLICSMTGLFRQSPVLDGAFDIKPLRMIYPSIGRTGMGLGSNDFNFWCIWAVTIKTACRPPNPGFSHITPETKMAICFVERETMHAEEKVSADA